MKIAAFLLGFGVMLLIGFGEVQCTRWVDDHCTFVAGTHANPQTYFGCSFHDEGP